MLVALFTATTATAQKKVARKSSGARTTSARQSATSTSKNGNASLYTVDRASLMKTKIGPKKNPVFIDQDFAVRHPINILTDGGSNKTELQAGSYVDVVVKKCPKWGNCVIFNIHYIDDDGPNDLTFSWSGHDTHLMDFGLGYSPVRGYIYNPRSSNTSLVYVDDNDTWVLILGKCDWMIGAGLKEGMTKAQVSKELSGDTPGNFTGGTKYGALTHYSFNSYAMEKQYHLNGDYHYNAGTKSYLDLYFRADGKLDRWCTNF